MNCEFCEKPSGLFRRSHSECRDQHDDGRQQISELINGYLQSDLVAGQLGERAREIADHHFVSTEEVHALAVAGFQSAVDGIVQYDPTKEEQAKLVSMQSEFALTQAEVQGGMDRLTEAQHAAGRQQISRLLDGYLRGPMSFDQLGDDWAREIQKVAETHHVSSGEIHSLAIAGFRIGVDAALEDKLISKDEEVKLVGFQKQFSLTPAELGRSIDRVAKAAILRDLDSGIVKLRVSVRDLPLNLLKDEKVLWAFNDVELYEIKTSTSYVGRSHGVSIRIARGLYYRVGAFKGKPVQTQDMVRQDVGALVVTNQNVYFSGPAKSLRIRFSKIVDVQAYSDGIALTRESVNPKPLTFKLDDPWFASNLILKLGAM